MDSLLTYLPQAEGLLPKWLLFVSSHSILSSSLPCGPRENQNTHHAPTRTQLLFRLKVLQQPQDKDEEGKKKNFSLSAH